MFTKKTTLQLLKEQRTSFFKIFHSTVDSLHKMNGTIEMNMEKNEEVIAELNSENEEYSEIRALNDKTINKINEFLN